MIEALFWLTLLYWFIAAVIFIVASMNSKPDYFRTKATARQNARIALKAWIWPWLVLKGIGWCFMSAAESLQGLKERAK